MGLINVRSIYCFVKNLALAAFIYQKIIYRKLIEVNSTLQIELNLYYGVIIAIEFLLLFQHYS